MPCDTDNVFSVDTFIISGKEDLLVMNAEFHSRNRQRLYESLPDQTVAILCSGRAIRKTADENYPFYADRNFLYLTGRRKRKITSEKQYLSFLRMPMRSDGQESG